MNFLLKFHYQVLKILAWDNLNHLVYYLGTQDNKPGQKHLYIVKDPVDDESRRYLHFVHIKNDRKLIKISSFKDLSQHASHVILKVIYGIVDIIIPIVPILRLTLVQRLPLQQILV